MPRGVYNRKNAKKTRTKVNFTMPKTGLIRVESGVPIPTGRGKWQEVLDTMRGLKKGENVFLPNGYNGREGTKLLNLARSALNKKINFGFVARTGEDGIRIWRS